MKHKHHKHNHVAPIPNVPPVRFDLFTRDATKVNVAGTFNDWLPLQTPLKTSGMGHWWTYMTLVPGTYEYRFVVDGEWQADPEAAASVPNSYGGVNSVLVVEPSAETKHLHEAEVLPLTINNYQVNECHTK